MAKVFNCKKCNERPVYECVSHDKDGNPGDFRRCNLCSDITPMVRRMTAKKKARAELFAWMMAQVD